MQHRGLKCGIGEGMGVEDVSRLFVLSENSEISRVCPNEFQTPNSTESLMKVSTLYPLQTDGAECWHRQKDGNSCTKVLPINQ